MRIPNASSEHEESELVITLLADTLDEAAIHRVLRKLYLSLFERSGGEYQILGVCTDQGNGIGHVITPLDALLAYRLGFLSEQESQIEHDRGRTGYSSSSYWRDLDMTKLFMYLNDTSLPPLKTEDQKPETVQK